MNSKSLTLSLGIAMALSLSLMAQTGMQQPSSQQPSSQQPMQQPSSQQPGMPPMQQPSTMPTTGGDEQQIRTLEDQARQAALRNDPSFIDQHATSDYVGIGAQGRQMSKSEVVTAMRSGDIRYQSIDTISSPTVRIFGDTAIVNGEASVKLTSFGQPVAGNFRYTRVWVKQGGQWKIASFESTPVQPQAR
jgi:hypothetical protein